MKHVKKIFLNTTVLSTIISLLMFVTGTPYAFAATVGFDTGGTSGTSPISLTISASAGVAVAYIVNGTAPCSMTLGGVSMRKELETTVQGVGWAAFYLASPPTGTKSLAWACGGGTGGAHAMTYLGTGFAPTADNVATAFKVNGGGTTLTLPITTASIGNVIGTSAASNGGVSFSQAAGMTFRNTLNIANRSEDNTNFATGPGTVNMLWDNGGNTTDIESIGMTIAAATSSAAAPFSFAQLFNDF